MTEVENVCVNCRAAVSTPRCGQCGQPNPPKKLNFAVLLKEFQTRIYGFDGMFLRSVRDLTLIPGEVARQFIQGNRVRYMGPVGYFFLVLTLSLLTMQLFEVDLYALSTTNSGLLTDETEQQKIFQQKIMALIQNNMRTFSFLQVPIAAFFVWLFFRKSRHNYLESCVLVFYTYGHLIWGSLIGVAALYFFSWNSSLLQILIGALFTGYACVGFYNYGSKVSRFIKGFLVSVASFVAFMLLGMIAAIVYLVSNPDMLKAFGDGAEK